ncbi:helix-turn-helix transcriptional regulator [Krasilnikoviella flava]|uniref:HTH araC/xylS-type domain-containing protein n=1 Tax=Krasilnikoviella flava TaxID=526729 RepID=A0A1T5L5D0_9MICO|nr:AraC family transcriptional regulator [Krasilnikoviella flava]SKC71181.1 hypothetical protein SAMN04324258_2903 [Krasilnikoviella flava]
MPVESVHRPSDSRYVSRVWRGRASGAETMTSVATSQWELVFWRDGRTTHAAVRGPETAATTARIAGESDSFGITFAHGTTMPHLPASALVDSELESPCVTARRFLLRGEEWPIPRVEDAELLVDRLVRAGVLVRDPLVDEVVWGGAARVGSRSVQRRVATATGLTQGAIRQIDRARTAAVLLREGAAPLDVVHGLGYFDQPHLARALRRFIGRTATQLLPSRAAASGTGSMPDAMSLLYKPEHPSSS